MEKGSIFDVANGSKYAFELHINLVLDFTLDMRLEHFPAQQSKQSTKCTVQVTNSSFRA